jgi:signal transduction histidine kinase
MVLKAIGQFFTLRIADDGEGFKLPATSTGMGLKIMKYRAGMIGAKFKVGPNEPRGTVITVTSERAVTPREHAGTNIQGDFTDGNQQRMGSSSGGRTVRVEYR